MNPTNTHDVWYVNLGASNHMTYHGEWFKDVKNWDMPRYVEIRDDTTRPISHIENAPLAMQNGKLKYLSNVLHVSSTTKNLVSFGQMIEQGLQAHLTLMAAMLKT